MMNNPIQSKNPVGYGFFPLKSTGGVHKLLPVNIKKEAPKLKAVTNI